MRSWRSAAVPFLLLAGAVLVVGTVVGVVAWQRHTAEQTVDESVTPAQAALRGQRQKTPRSNTSSPNLVVWWDAVPENVRQNAVKAPAESNIHPGDYVGPAACKKCHEGNYRAWSQHPHRWMNALADESTVRGDFSGAQISYLGGTATFERDGNEYVMRLERDGVRRAYEIHQTIGSRFFQYYVGTLREGPEPEGHRFYSEDHVMHFGYWLEEREWVPVVHVDEELPDVQRADPFAPPDSGTAYARYAVSCNHCHTTFPLGDMFTRNTGLIGRYAPARLNWWLPKYLEQAHPELLAAAHPADVPDSRIQTVFADMLEFQAPEHAATLGVSCEACHLGAREHVASGGKTLPRFFPASPHLVTEAAGAEVRYDRSHDNVNWACGRCHTGHRPEYAAGMSTWNSTEYTDAMKGSCYSELTCVHCHNPHQGTGAKWSRTPVQDDALCIKCHTQLETDEGRTAHTHHTADSRGSRCMNCHMPRLNEGLQDVVRTHMIFSPTEPSMIEANHPNACNLCHTDQTLGWTKKHLKEWYGATYAEAGVTDELRPAALDWLASENEAVRLAAASALFHEDDRAALPQLVDALDDDYLINRQFARRGLEQMLKIKLSDFGYRHYMTRQERQEPIERLREKLLSE